MIRNLSVVDPHGQESAYYKRHVCLGSYNETAQHAKRQHNGAEESSRQQRRGARQGGVQGRATEQGSKAAGQGSRARQQGKAGEQGSRARQGNSAGQQAKFNLQTAAEVRTFVNKYVGSITSFYTLAQTNLQTAAEV